MAAQAFNVLITGANRGLGLEMVKQMLEGSHPVKMLFACCRDPDGPRAEGLRTLAKKHPNIVHPLRLDATDLHSIKQCAQKVGSLVGTGGLNLLINNAGFLDKANLQECTEEGFQMSLNTNVLGPLNVIKEFLPLLRAGAKACKTPGLSTRKAAVINISSILGSVAAAKDTFALFTALTYRISKAGLNMLTACAAQELKQDQILFAVLHPGWVRTDMGGPDGEIDAPESVQGMLRVMSTMTEQHNGSFLDYKGSIVPW